MKFQLKLTSKQKNSRFQGKELKRRIGFASQPKPLTTTQPLQFLVDRVGVWLGVPSPGGNCRQFGVVPADSETFGLPQNLNLKQILKKSQQFSDPQQKGSLFASLLAQVRPGAMIWDASDANPLHRRLPAEVGQELCEVLLRLHVYAGKFAPRFFKQDEVGSRYLQLILSKFGIQISEMRRMR